MAFPHPTPPGTTRTGRSRITREVLFEVADERLAQDEKWGEQNHPDGSGPRKRLFGFSGEWAFIDLANTQRETTDRHARTEKLTWSDIFLEEVFEAVSADTVDELREELLQVAAVAVSWVEAIDRRAKS